MGKQSAVRTKRKTFFDFVIKQSAGIASSPLENSFTDIISVPCFKNIATESLNFIPSLSKKAFLLLKTFSRSPQINDILPSLISEKPWTIFETFLRLFNWYIFIIFIQKPYSNVLKNIRIRFHMLSVIFAAPALTTRTFPSLIETIVDDFDFNFPSS